MQLTSSAPPLILYSSLPIWSWLELWHLTHLEDIPSHNSAHPYVLSDHFLPHSKHFWNQKHRNTKMGGCTVQHVQSVNILYSILFEEIECKNILS